MKIRIFILTTLLAGVSLAAQTRPERQLLDVAMNVKITPDKFIYNWRDAVFLNALADTYRLDEAMRPQIAQYFEQTMLRFVDTAYGKHPNAVASSIGFAFLKEIGKNTNSTDEALSRVLLQYSDICRSVDGGCSHRPGRVELWDDTVYMLDMALLGTYKATGNRAYLDRFVEEMTAHANHLEDSVTGMWYHGWSESYFPSDDDCSQYGWNTNPLRRNDEFWGRGNGWVAMSYADLLEVLSPDSPAYSIMSVKFKRMAGTLLKYQDRESGLWYQLPLHPKDKGNFLESSCSVMFAFALAKGARLGILSEKSEIAAQKAYDGIIKRNISNPGTSEMEITGICAGTCIGDRDYYYNRDIISNESYAIGAFIMLGNELKRINK